MVKGYAKVKQSVIGIGNHLGSFSDEDSNSYIKAMEYGVLNGINSLDTAVNYRGMRSEKVVWRQMDCQSPTGISRR